MLAFRRCAHKCSGVPPKALFCWLPVMFYAKSDTALDVLEVNFQSFLDSCCHVVQQVMCCLE